MYKFFKPTWYSNNFYNIDFVSIKNNKIDFILCDLDNTIVEHYVDLPNNKVVSIISLIKKLGIEFYLISNNKEDRVKKFCERINIKYLHSTKKPCTKKIKKFIKQNNIDINKTLVIGDQILTDIWMANILKCRSLLVEPATNSDLFVTKFNRFADKIIRKSLAKKGKLKSVERNQ
ncbi:MAG: YqeG family HAD IIIA-type phosphatase [Bacilli bacterium]|nr:YqeG family HAD IIIA-type phosphatase [Bacilli bacterium]